MDSDDEVVEVLIESERPFTLRMSRTKAVTTDDPEWVSVSPIGDRSILVVVSGSPTYRSSVADMQVFVPLGARVSVPSGMTAHNEAVDVGVEITER